MAAVDASPKNKRSDAPPLMLGGHAALAESEWMGVAQASDVLEPLHIAVPPDHPAAPALGAADARAHHRRGLLRPDGLVLLLRALGGGASNLIQRRVRGRPTILILFEHGEFDVSAGSLTYAVLVPYAVALPAYVATEMVTRGLIALRDTRTPLLTNSVQLAGRAAIIALLLGSMGVLAIPIAFAVVVLLLKPRRRMNLGAAVAL